MGKTLINKIVIVSGGCGLLGKEFVKSIINEGGIGIIADINEEQGEKTKEEISKGAKSGAVEFFKMDITSKDSISNIIREINSKYGKIDALVNSAYPRNKNYGRSFFEVEYADFCENVNLHLGGYFLTTQQFAYYFNQLGEGNIINIASIYGVIAPRFEIYKNTKMTTPIEYAVIKSALIHLTKYTARYLRGSNVRVNSISPGGIFDNQPESFLENYKSFSSNKGMLDKDDLNGTLKFLLSDDSRFINGQNIIVDDGFTL